MALFEADAVIRRIAAEPALIIGGGRALLLQLAHPMVAQGVADHSDFEHDPLPRLVGTLDFLTFVVWGDDAEAERAAGTVRRIHDHVTGAGYFAGDPTLQTWVNATLVDTALDSYRRLFGPLPEEIEDRYYQEATKIAEILGCPRDAQPTTLADFRDYVTTTVATLEVTDTARRLAQAVLAGRNLPRIYKPALPIHRFITAGLLPAPIRSQYGLRWSDRRDRALAALLRTAGATSHLPPATLRRHAPALYLRSARRRARRLDSVGPRVR